jgi:sugar phosphate isomerase/epimerase
MILKLEARMLALSTGSLYTYGLDRVFGLAKEAGFDGIEVLVDGRWDTRQADYLKYLMDRHGLPVVSLHSPFDLICVPGWEQDPLWRLKRTVELAEALVAQVVVAHPPLGWLRISLRVTGASNKRDFWVGLPLSWFVGRPYARWLCHGLESFQRETEVTVTVENMPRRRIGPLGFDLYQMTRLESLERFRHLTLDTTHLATHGIDILQTYERLAGRVAHVHLSNYNGLEHRLLQDGHLPLADFLRRLKQDGYRGVVTLELQPDALGAGDDSQVLANLRTTVDFYRRHFAWEGSC